MPMVTYYHKNKEHKDLRKNRFCEMMGNEDNERKRNSSYKVS